MSSRLILYGNAMWSSPYVLSCFVGLTEKKVPFEVRTVALDEGAQRAPDYVRTSFTARVPALVDGDFTLSESSAIIEYLEDKWPGPEHPPLLPPNIEARARARQIMAWVRSDLGPLREERSSEYVFFPLPALPAPKPLSPAAKQAVEKLVGFAERVVPADGGTLFGDWCIADTDLAMMLQRLVKTTEPLPPRLRAFAEREWQRPSVRAFLEAERPARHRPALT
jgi:glutathione S-transferase